MPTEPAWPARSARPGRARAVGSARQVAYGPQQRSYDSEARQIVSGAPDGFLIVDSRDTYREGRPGAGADGQAGTRRRRSSPMASPRATCRVSVGARRPRDARHGPGWPNTGAAAEAFDKLYTKAPGAGPLVVRRPELRRRDPLLPGGGRGGLADGVDMAGSFARSAARAARSTPGRSFPMRSTRSRTATTSTTRARPGRSTWTPPVTHGGRLRPVPLRGRQGSRIR